MAATPRVPAYPKEGAYQVSTRAELQTLPPPAWLVKHWLMRQGITFLSGPSGSFKSFLAMNLGLCIANSGIPKFGDHWIDRSTAAVPGGPLSVLYVIGESESYTRIRLNAAARKLGVPIAAPDGEETFWVRNNKVDLFAERARVIDMVDYFDPDVVIFDTWSRNTGMADENPGPSLNQVLQTAHEIKRGGHRGGRAVMFLHHPTKDGSDPLRGALKLLNDTDILIQATREGKVPGRFYSTIQSLRQKELADFKPYEAHLEEVVSYEADGVTSELWPGTSDVITTLVINSFEKAAPRAVAGMSGKRSEVWEYMKLHPGCRYDDMQEAVWPEKPTGTNVYGVVKSLIEAGLAQGNNETGFIVLVPVLAPLEDM